MNHNPTSHLLAVLLTKERPERLRAAMCCCCYGCWSCPRRRRRCCLPLKIWWACSACRCWCCGSSSGPSLLLLRWVSAAARAGSSGVSSGLVAGTYSSAAGGPDPRRGSWFQRQYPAVTATCSSHSAACLGTTRSPVAEESCRCRSRARAGWPLAALVVTTV